MALSKQSASIGGAARNLIVALDTNSSLAAAHVTVNSSGIEVGTSANPIAVAVANSPAVQPVSLSSLPLPSGAATAAGQASLHVDGGALAHITNLPATQAVSGTIAVSGLPALPAGTNSIGTVALASGTSLSVSNLPAVQSVSGTVTVNAGTGVMAVSAASLPLAAGAATSAKQPALGTAGSPSADVLTIQGSTAGTPLPVSVTFPASQSVTLASPLPAGTNALGSVALASGASVQVSNLPATQAVSLASFPPLAAGSNAIGSVTVNGTAAVSAASLPLPSGAATAAKQPALGTAGASATDVLSIQGISGGVPLPVGGTVAIGAAASSTPVSISGVDGSGNKQHLRTDTFGAPSDAAWSSGAGSLVALGKAMVAAAQATTAAVTSSSIVPPSPSFVQTSALASGLLLKGGPGSLYACYVTTGATAGWLMLFDAAAVPSNGAVTPKECVYCPANATTDIELPFLTAEPFSTGIAAAFSSTGPFTLTASASVFIKGIVQ